MIAVDLFAGGGGLERFPRGPRNAVMVTAHGLTLSLSEWSRRTGVHHVVIRNRLARGWHPEKAVVAAPLSKNAATWAPIVEPEQLRALYEGGKTKLEIAAELGVSEKVFTIAMRRFGIKSRRPFKRNQLRERNTSWKGGRLIDGAGYVVVLRPGDPRANGRGYVREHLLVMAQKLGRPVAWFGADDPRTEVVHHVDGNKQNNDPSNLELLNPASHADEHRDPITGRLGRVHH